MGTEDGRAGLVEAHAAVSSRDDLIADRRSLYRFAISLAGIRSESPNDTVDSPVSRAAVGRMLDGGASIVASDLVDIGELCSGESRITDGSIGVVVASSPNAQHHLQDALDIISGHAGSKASALSDLSLLTAVSDGFDRAFDTIADGFRLAMSRDRALLADLLPHVGMVVVLDRQTSGRLGSASAREFPGLVVLPDPTTAVEVAEALVHEAAHQKIFDMSITNDVIGVNAQGCAPFSPDWSPPGTAWPLEQVFAAWHAYTCLARFRDSLTPDDLAAIGRSSLLEPAADRAEQLGARLLCCGRHLGRDAHKLIESVLGVPPDERWVDDLASVYDGATHRDSGERVEVHRLPTRSRALAGWGGVSPQVFWVESAVDGSTPG